MVWKGVGSCYALKDYTMEETSLIALLQMVYFKDKYYCPIEIIKGLTDKGQFQYLTKLMGPQEETYLYIYNTISFTKIKINIVS